MEAKMVCYILRTTSSRGKPKRGNDFDFTYKADVKFDDLPSLRRQILRYKKQ